MRFSAVFAFVLCAVSLQSLPSRVLAQTGLNSIPTTDIVPHRIGDLELENGNNSLKNPSFRRNPRPSLIGEFGLARRIEAGFEYHELEEIERYDFTFNFKAVLQYEHRAMPSLAVGMSSLGSAQRAAQFLTITKTINYSQLRGHHHRNHRIFGRRIHAGVVREGKNAIDPFFGVDVEVNNHFLVQSDWITGAGNAVTAGFEWTLPDNKTAINPFILFSNDNHRIDGFQLSFSHEFDL